MDTSSSTNTSPAAAWASAWTASATGTAGYAGHVEVADTRPICGPPAWRVLTMMRRGDVARSLAALSAPILRRGMYGRIFDAVATCSLDSARDALGAVAVWMRWADAREGGWGRADLALYRRDAESRLWQTGIIRGHVEATIVAAEMSGRVGTAISGYAAAAEAHGAATLFASIADGTDGIMDMRRPLIGLVPDESHDAGVTDDVAEAARVRLVRWGPHYAAAAVLFGALKAFFFGSGIDHSIGVMLGTGERIAAALFMRVGEPVEYRLGLHDDMMVSDGIASVGLYWREPGNEA